MTAPAGLPEAWRDRADQLRRYGAEPQALALEACAAELEGALRQRAGEVLTLQEAAAESGYSERRLRELIAEGTIPQAGRKGAPRIRRADLPIRPGSGTSAARTSYDVESDADALVGRLSS